MPRFLGSQSHSHDLAMPLALGSDCRVRVNGVATSDDSNVLPRRACVAEFFFRWAGWQARLGFPRFELG